MVPENRRRAYDVRTAAEGRADTGPALEPRRGFGAGTVTALVRRVRVGGRPAGLIADDPERPGGAIDRDAADRAARILQAVRRLRPPVVSPCDSPGSVVGPESERTVAVGHFSRPFVTGAHPGVPVVCLWCA
ncbi:carboxyl transferase domain-containing protein [Streptomyces sp. NPDC003016]